MEISKTGKITIGILTLSQLFIGLLAIIWFFTTLLPVFISGDDAAIEHILILSLGKFLVFAIILAVLSTGILIFYLVHAGTNRNISTAMKIVWILLLLFFGTLVEVVYFFMEIAPEKSMTGRIENS